MKAAKRIFLILLAVVMIAVAIPITVSAANVCTINGTGYTSFDSALAAAKSSSSDVTIELCANISTTASTKIENSANRKITINGNGYTVTAGTYNGILVYTHADFKNLNINHNNAGSAIQILKHPNSSTINVNVENVNINSTAKIERRYTTINALGNEEAGGATVNLGLTNVNIVLDADPTTAGEHLSAVRTGNGNDTVNMEIVNCNFDVSAVLHARGIHVWPGTTATVNVRDTNIKTNIGYPIVANDQTVNIYGGSLMTSGFDYKTNPYNAVGGKTKTNFYTSSGAVIVPELYIYGCQETTPSGGFFKTRFICAAKEDKLSTYKNIKMVLTVANASNILVDQTYNISEMYSSVKAGSGSASEAGYCFGTAEIGNIPSDYECIFTVELYATVNGVESMYDSETFTYASGAYADSDYDAFDYTISRKDLTGRYLLVSDLHYVGDGTGGRNSGDTDRRTYRGATNAQRMQLLCDSIEQEHKLRGLDGILVLGDLSTDDWYSGVNSSWLTDYYCYNVYRDYLKPLADRLGIDIRVIAGNHDSYYNGSAGDSAAKLTWNGFFGYDRQYTYVDGDNVFIMIDNFGGNVDADDAEGAGNGSEWRETDTAWLKTQLDLYASKKNIFLCSHEFGECSDAMKNLLANYTNVVALFEGHTHHFSGSSLFGKTGLPLLNTGNFAYGVYDSGSGRSNDFGAMCTGCGTDYNCLWGFQIIETSASNVTSYRVNVPHTYSFNTYTYSGSSATKTGTVTHVQPYVKYDDIILK